MVYRLHTSDRTAFKRCRRQWDFSSGNRQNLELAAHPASIDLNKALRDALSRAIALRSTASRLVLFRGSRPGGGRAWPHR